MIDYKIYLNTFSPDNLPISVLVVKLQSIGV